MALRAIIAAALAATALSGAANADDTYRCGDRVCYDDQADETRRLNEMQLDNPGAGIDAVPPPDDRAAPVDDDPYADEYEPQPYGDDAEDPDGRGGPYEPEDPEDAYDPYDDDGPYDGAPPDADAYDPDDPYPSDDADPDAVDEDDCEPGYCDPDAGAYPDPD